MDEAATWDRISNRYDRVVRIFDRSYPEVRARLATDLAGRDRVLEVAAGTGQFTKAIARVAMRVITSDVSEEMTDRLRVAVTNAVAAVSAATGASSNAQSTVTSAGQAISGSVESSIKMI